MRGHERRDDLGRVRIVPMRRISSYVSELWHVTGEVVAALGRHLVSVQRFVVLDGANGNDLAFTPNDCQAIRPRQSALNRCVVLNCAATTDEGDALANLIVGEVGWSTDVHRVIVCRRLDLRLDGRARTTRRRGLDVDRTRRRNVCDPDIAIHKGD
jgi:hypothetical protein